MLTLSWMLQRDAVRERHQWLVPGAIIALLSLTASCRSAPPRPAEDCAGQSILVVENRTRDPLDILLVQGSSSRFVGSAGPGRSTFSLLSLDVPANSYFAARRPRAGFLSVHNDSLTFHRECR